MTPRPARTRLLHLVAASSCSVACLLPASAHAYCRSSDEVGSSGECVPNPSGPFLTWERNCTGYSFNNHFVSEIKLSDTLIRSAFHEAFDAWAAVSCDGRKPFFVEQLPGTTITAQSEYLKDQPDKNESVILAIDSARWASMPDHSPRAIALTLMWHNKTTGVIVDWDMELNLGAGKFADCVAQSCLAGTIDLQNTITHEAGHVLGLGHSLVPDSTMVAQTVGVVDTEKRTLSADDKEGYCALKLPESPCSDDDCVCGDGASSTAPEPQQTSDTTPIAGKYRIKKGNQCQVLTPGVRSEVSAWLLLGAALIIARATRRSRR